MDIWAYDTHNQLTDAAGNTQKLQGSVVTIGVFDGVHRGHQLLLECAVKNAQYHRVPAVMLTFDPHPLAVIKPEVMPPLLSDVPTRAEAAQAKGIDILVGMKFDHQLAAMSPEEFFRTVIVDTLHAHTVVVGANFTFGHKAAGTTETLQALGEIFGVDVVVLPLLEEEGIVLSSSAIRAMLQAHNVRGASWALDHPYTVTGVVTKGAGRGGKELGFPTANLYFPETVALPADGVYCGWFTVIDDLPLAGTMKPQVKYPTAISIGTNPTFGDHRRSVEAFVLDQDSDLYGHKVAVEFINFIREMEKFSNVEELLETMNNDVRLTKILLD